MFGDRRRPRSGRRTVNARRSQVRQRLAKQRLRPNFGNAGAVENLVSEAVARAERRLADLPPAERALRNDLVVDDLYVEAPHVADPSLVFAGLIGCEAVKAKLHEYKSVVEAARLVGRDGMEDLGMTFAFQGAPGTGKTTVARRMGMLFEALGVLPSSEVVQVSASDLVTGYVGQAARKTRDVFESARGAVLFIDEAYRLYDPTGRSYSSAEWPSYWSFKSAVVEGGSRPRRAVPRGSSEGRPDAARAIADGLRVSSPLGTSRRRSTRS